MKPVDKYTARIGFFGDKYEFEAYVVTDDVCQIPHFHVRDALQMGILDAPVRLDASSIFNMGKVRTSYRITPSHCWQTLWRSRAEVHIL